MKKWLSFLFQFTLVAVVGSAAIMAGANHVSPEKARLILDKMNRLGFAKVESAVRENVDDWLEPIDIGWNEPETDEQQSLDFTPIAPPGPEVKEPPAPLPDEDTTPQVAHETVEPEPAPPQPHTPPEPVQPETPAATWGVTHTEGTRVYTTEGRFLRRLDAGTFMVIKKRQETSAGNMLVADVLYQGRSVPNIVIRSEDVQELPASFADASPTEQRLISHRARILARISAIETEIAYGLRKNNPHCNEYVKARDAFKEFSDRIRPKREAYENATGARRDKLGEELHAVRAESFQLGNAYRTAKMRYSQWNEQNPVDLKTLPDMVRLKSQLAHVESQISGLAGP